MRLQFKHQKFQADAAKAVVDVFAGQPYLTPTYMMDRGSNYQLSLLDKDEFMGWRNEPIVPELSDAMILERLRKIQRANQIKPSERIEPSESCKFNLTIEMETGVGKTYTYIKTMYELNKHYGWSKFIVVVPSIAIREGVYKSFQVTRDHFAAEYGEKIRFFIYNSAQLTEIDRFASDSSINVMIINSQAFNARGKNARRIYMKLDEFRSRRPIDIIAKTNPILIIDEPQSVEGKQTKERLRTFNPLLTLRYSATHKSDSIYNMVYRLDAMEAYNKRLVKKIAVKGITESGSTATEGYVYLEGINLSKADPTATIEFDFKGASAIRKKTMKVGIGFNLYDHSGNLDEYKDGFVVKFIDGRDNSVEFLNGVKLFAGDVVGKVSEDQLRRIQIRETILSHIERERQLFHKGIKVLSLFFIDEVAKYKQYDEGGNPYNGIYADMFEEEYEDIVGHMQREFGDEEYMKYLDAISAHDTHAGYFSIDKKGMMTDSKLSDKKAGTSDDIDAYDLIMKNKELLLDRDPKRSPVRFIFSHSALREGWDNPNVFVMCMLKHSDSTISRRQEVGRGLRLCVNQQGERMDNPLTTHQLNVLTVITSESYTDFVSNLQKEIRETISDRPRKAETGFFSGKVVQAADGTRTKIDDAMANMIHAWLLKNDYIDEVSEEVTATYHEAREQDRLKPMRPELFPYTESIVTLIDSLYLCAQGIPVSDESKSRTNLLNGNFRKKEFQELWRRINHKAIYRVDFDSGELIRNCIDTLNAELKVTPLKYVVVTGMQQDNMTTEHLEQGSAFTIKKTETEFSKSSVHSQVKYDLLGKLAELTKLTRKTLALMLSGVHASTFDLFRQNPEEFISEAGRLINEQKATCIIERLSYDCLSESYDSSIFTEAQVRLAGDTGQKLQKHIYDYVNTQSGVERRFADRLDTAGEVVVYAKLPSGFFIPTPVGPYNPDWAIAFKEGCVKHIYFVAETKGSMSSMELRGVEETKIACARKFFNMLTEKLGDNRVTYDVVDSYDKLMDIVKA